MDVLEGYFKRLCMSGAADRIAALQDQIRRLTAQLADGQTTLYYSEAARERLAAQLAQAEQRAAERRPPAGENDPLLVYQLSTAQKLSEQLELQIAHLQSQAVIYQQKLEQQRAEIADLNRKLFTQNVTQAVKKALDSVPQGMNLLQWEAYTTDLRRQIQHGATQVTTLTRRIKELKQQLNGCTPLTSDTAPPQNALPIIQRKENQHRPLQAALHLAGTLQTTVPIAALGLSTRNRNRLLRCGNIQTLNVLLTWTPHQLLQLRDAGPHALKEVEAHLCALWPQLPPEYFQPTVPYNRDGAAAWGVQPQYGRPRY